MFTAITVIHIIVSIVIVIAVLLQVGKGASIGSTFGGASSQTLFGSAGPATLLAKVTYAGVAIFMVTS
ncbi:MAG: preprotein translocase subunit SecG, partial [Deltaproteobacteria bacterium RBG_19FT_COMBO_58_16]